MPVFFHIQYSYCKNADSHTKKWKFLVNYARYEERNLSNSHMENHNLSVCTVKQ